jgi:hypothetical protein
VSSPVNRSASLTAAVLALAALAAPAYADGRIDPGTLVTHSMGTFNGVPYVRSEAMFAGTTSSRHPYRVPCQVIAPAAGQPRSGLLLFDWLNRTTIFTAIGRELGFGRYVLGDALLFGQGAAYATVRCDPIGIGRPWSDGILDTSSEFIQWEADEFEIVADFARALRSDAATAALAGPVQRMASFGFSACAGRLRGLLRMDLGRGLFDFSLVGGWGSGYLLPRGNVLGLSSMEIPPLDGAGLEADFNTEHDVLRIGAAQARFSAWNYRAYEYAGAAHIRRADAALAGLPDPETANPADWFPLVRALFQASSQWCDGVPPPPAAWLGAPGDATIARDAKGNALVRYVDGLATATTYYRLPEVAVGLGRYIGYDGSYESTDWLRLLAGAFVDLSGTFTSHQQYVDQIRDHARFLRQQRYLLEADEQAIIGAASSSTIGER